MAGFGEIVAVIGVLMCQSYDDVTSVMELQTEEWSGGVPLAQEYIAEGRYVISRRSNPLKVTPLAQVPYKDLIVNPQGEPERQWIVAAETLSGDIVFFATTTKVNDDSESNL